jgi:hypothetical protein
MQIAVLWPDDSFRFLARPQVETCPKCSKPISSESNFCTHCGTALGERTVTVTTAASGGTAAATAVAAATESACSSPCREGRHYACGYKNCSCTCHTKTGKPKPTGKQLVAGVFVWLVLFGIVGGIIAFLVGGHKAKNAEVPAAETPAAYKINDNVTVGYWSYKVRGTKWADSIGPDFMRQQADAKFLIIALTARNNDKTASVLPPVKLVDAQGREFEESEKGMMLEHSFGPLKSLNPTVESTGVIVFDVPPGKYWVVLSGGFASGDTVKIELN